MDRDKLKQLHDFVRDKVKDDWFYLGSWTSNAKKFRKKECGTTACLFGWATVVFPKDLRFYNWKDKLFHSETRRWMYVVLCKSALMKEVEFDTFDVAAHFFGISGQQAHFLFDPHFYPERTSTSRQEALKRLKWFIENAPNNFFISTYNARRSLIPTEDNYETLTG